MQKSVYRLTEVAEILQVSRSHVYCLIQAKKLRPTLIGTRGMRITAAELARFLEAQTGLRR